jgi:hypothetical protein
MNRKTAVTVFLVPAVVAAPPPPKNQQQTKLVPRPRPTAIPRPDLQLTELRLEMVKRNGTMPSGLPCWIFNLQPVFHNAGSVGTGPFKVVWERADAETGPYTVPCALCTMNIANAAPGVGMLPPARQFNNCGGMKWYRVRLDPANVVKESNETNNSKLIHF